MQRDVQEFVSKYGVAHDVETRYIDLVSEIGELGKELLKSGDYGAGEIGANSEMAMELGDCLFSLLALAESLKLDAEGCLKKALDKYKNRHQNSGDIGSQEKLPTNGQPLSHAYALSTKEAKEMLREAELLNPGPWVDHSVVVAEAAAGIAAACNGLDEECAYIYGLLHDIGRREGKSAIRHIFDGYSFLMSRGFEDAAIICLTHSFPDKNPNHYMGDIDVGENEMTFLNDFLKTREYTDYDRLIQLCDAICLPEGVVLMEKRLMDVAMRYGVESWVTEKWKEIFALKEYFDGRLGHSIYALFPSVEKNTFG